MLNYQDEFCPKLMSDCRLPDGLCFLAGGTPIVLELINAQTDRTESVRN